MLFFDDAMTRAGVPVFDVGFKGTFFFFFRVLVLCASLFQSILSINSVCVCGDRTEGFLVLVTQLSYSLFPLISSHTNIFL